MNTGDSKGCRRWIIIIGILILLGICGAGQVAFDQQKRADEKFDTVAGIANKEADALIKQAEALQEQAHAISVQAETNAQAVDHIIDQSETIRLQAETTAKISVVAVGGIALLAVILLIVLGGRRVAS